MRVQAPAKINLHLRVGPIRADGFHPIVSWMSTIGLFDILEIDRSHGCFTLNCDSAAVTCDASNLVVKAVAALADSVAKGSSAGLIASLNSSNHLTEKEVGGEARDLDGEPRNREGGAMTDFCLKVALHKRIPVGAGLGGGSSDGAFILLALNRLWNLNWPQSRLMEIAKSIGSASNGIVSRAVNEFCARLRAAEIVSDIGDRRVRHPRFLRRRRARGRDREDCCRYYRAESYWGSVQLKKIHALSWDLCKNDRECRLAPALSPAFC